MNNTSQTIAIVAIVGVAAYAIYKWIKKEVELKTGWNTVTYTGKEQVVGEALASIWDYFLIGYHWNTDTQLWDQLLSNTVMIPGESYEIKVSQDCVWRM